MSTIQVPDFHSSDTKRAPLDLSTLPDDDYAARCLRFLQEFVGGPLDGLKILDVGCGRGDLVHRLRRAGARAFGLEVEARYLESGRVLNEVHHDEMPILALAPPGGRLPYPDDCFDLVVSFQVLEHVAQLEPLAVELARVLRPGGTTVHIFPAKYRVNEPHYGLPFVHWLPKNRVRQSAIRALLSLGMARDILRGHSVEARTHSIYGYSNEQTFYRSAREVAQMFSSAGLVPGSGRGAEALVRSRRPRVPFKRGIGTVMNLFRTTVFEARKPGAEPSGARLPGTQTADSTARTGAQPSQ